MTVSGDLNRTPAPERERAIEAATAAIRSQRLNGSLASGALATAAVDALLALPDPVREIARELLAIRDSGNMAMFAPAQELFDRLRAALEEGS